MSNSDVLSSTEASTGSSDMGNKNRRCSGFVSIIPKGSSSETTRSRSDGNNSLYKDDGKRCGAQEERVREGRHPSTVAGRACKLEGKRSVNQIDA